MSRAVICYEAWIAHTDSGEIDLVELLAVEEDGQKRLLDTYVVSPFDKLPQISNWIWAKLTLDIAGSLG